MFEIFGQGTDIAESKSVQNARKAKVLLDKVAEYQSIAKTSEQEEQKYDMVDNVRNNGDKEKVTKEVCRREKNSSVKPSLKARLAEKQKQVSGKGQQHKELDTVL